MSTDTPDESGLDPDSIRGIFGLDFRTADTLYQLLLSLSAAFFFVLIMFPIYWMLQSSLKTRSGREAVSWLPTGETFTLEYYTDLIGSSVGTFIFNSVVVTLGTIVLVVIVSLIAGYGLARLEFGHKENFARFLLFGYMFSPIVLGLPLYLIWRNLGLLGTRVGLIVALTAISMPFSVWLMWKYIQTIPEAMEESAWVAGASRWRGFRDVVIPQTQPAIIASALFAFALAWNDYTFASILLPEQQQMTFAPGLLQLINTGYGAPWGQVMAVSMLTTIPPLLFAYFLQSYLLKGFQIRSL
ncbi:carbohydrate ABC transporter permease [Halosegnis longus]|uniref:Carbohydrate ABC transporter permease n=1 Tax=Halosegnis longus TaxID=2216012 RepID=A0AAJ4R879_9EURY|nr:MULTISPECIES: carbohydrate ABC transporter permease [Halobacteriales]RNJ25997.1 carbohydrate ABC transporter permease [Salella cibi]